MLRCKYTLCGLLTGKYSHYIFCALRTNSELISNHKAKQLYVSYFHGKHNGQSNSLIASCVTSSLVHTTHQVDTHHFNFFLFIDNLGSFCQGISDIYSCVGIFLCVLFCFAFKGGGVLWMSSTGINLVNKLLTFALLKQSRKSFPFSHRM